MNRKIAICVGMLICWNAAAQAADVDVNGGLVVCLGADALESVSGDWMKPGCVFHCLETSNEIARLRETIRAAGCYGKVSVVAFDGGRLPYINNLADMVVIGETEFGVPAEEVQRVLAPYGKAVAPNGSASMPKPASPSGSRFVEFTKPYPPNFDEWPQYLHGADNNCIAQDTVVGPPRHVQWISGPAWTRSHMGAPSITSMISSGGRLFTIEDTETAENPLLPSRWKLIARSAFNGVVLWSLDFPEWETVMVYIKDYHAQMKRRLVAIDDTVYCTPGIDAPVTALNAATGKTIRQFAGTEGTQEFAYHDGRLYLVIGDRMNFDGYPTALDKKKKKGKKRKEVASETDSKNAFNGYGFPLSAYARRRGLVEKPTCVVAAIDATTGNEVWRTKAIDDYVGCTLALKGDKLVYQSAHGVFCLDAGTGKEAWAVNKEIPYGTGSSPHSLVLTADAVYSEEGKKLHAYSLADGSDYWGKSISVAKGYRASSDILIAAGALWMCGAGGTPTSYDLRTGDKINTIAQQLSKPMGHDRCFRNFITERFYINSKTGGPDCLDLVTGTEYPNPFTRATCSMGALPCNGLIYAGPYSCQCHLTVGLHNFNVYYTDENSLPTDGQVVKVQRSVRLEKGPAYGDASDDADAPWPTYRQDARRYAGTDQAVRATGMKRFWNAQLSTAGTAPTIADGKVFVAEKDAHTLRAFDAGSGEALWKYVAGGRIDSPPTYYKGSLLFGSRDGCVHSVRAGDGTLCWRFRDLPDQLMCAFGQLESAWPVHGSVLIKNDVAYFCAGRSSYLDGGLFIYGLNPVTGQILHQRQFYGPYAEDGFPEFARANNRSDSEVVKGTTADVMSSEGNTLYIRHQAFNLDLTDGTADKHLLASAGLLESKRQHREYTLVGEKFNHRKTWTSIDNVDYPTGDILVSDGTDYYAVFGMPVNRHSWFDPRKDGYALVAKTNSANGWENKWNTNIPLTGKAMALAGETVFVAGTPLVFDEDDLAATYEGRRGGILWAASATDGSKLAEYTLDKLPTWDGIAAAYGKLFIVNQDGSIECWGAGKT